MNAKEWRLAYAELADRYFEITGELIPRPINPATGLESDQVAVSPRRMQAFYVDEKMSVAEIALLLRCSDTTVRRMLSEFDIPLRPRGAAKKTSKRKKSGQRPVQQIRSGEASHARRVAAGYEFGGKEYKASTGYVRVYAPEHPYARSRYVMRARLVMERKLGRYLAENEVVHHINHVRDDDRVENLMLMDKQEHWQMHLAEGFHAREEKGFKICRDKLLELYQLGMSDGKIGKELGVSKETVRYTRLRMGLPAHVQKRSSKTEGAS